MRMGIIVEHSDRRTQNPLVLIVRTTTKLFSFTPELHLLLVAVFVNGILFLNIAIVFADMLNIKHIGVPIQVILGEKIMVYTTVKKYIEVFWLIVLLKSI